MRHVLDRPVWSALSTRHAALAEGGDRARRYLASVTAFAATRDDEPESLRALEDLTRPDEGLLMVQADDISLPPGLVASAKACGVQMIAERPAARVTDGRVVRLTRADAEEMLALATLTKPGPFSLRAQDLGEFWGVKFDGRLAAMAGERMKQVGFTELSGVCTHPDFRGRGLARLLSLFVTGRIFERGEIAYLHAYEANSAAINLYESLGFKLRTRMNVAAVQRRG